MAESAGAGVGGGGSDECAVYLSGACVSVAKCVSADYVGSVAGAAAHYYCVAPDASVGAYEADVEYAEAVSPVVEASTYVDVDDAVV